MTGTCFPAFTTNTLSANRSGFWTAAKNCQPLSDTQNFQQPVWKLRECCLLSNAPSFFCSSTGAWAASGFYCVAECKSAHTNTYAHTQKRTPHRTCGQTALHNTVASSLTMHNAWEHVNTLFRACINDHGETRSLSTRAINKRWRTDKGPYLPVSKTPSPPPLHHLIC